MSLPRFLFLWAPEPRKPLSAKAQAKRDARDDCIFCFRPPVSPHYRKKEQEKEQRRQAKSQASSDTSSKGGTKKGKKKAKRVSFEADPVESEHVVPVRVRKSEPLLAARRAEVDPNAEPIMVMRNDLLGRKEAKKAKVPAKVEKKADTGTQPEDKGVKDVEAKADDKAKKEDTK